MRMSKLTSINPYDGTVLAEFETLTSEQVDAKIELAYQAFSVWRDTPSFEKKTLFLKLADVIDADIEQAARLQTLEMWMLYTDSVAGLKKTADLIRWFAHHFEEILAPQDFDTEWTKGQYIYEPLGVIFWIAPWNFPYNQVLRAAVPNILAGNTQVYKHASNVPLCAQKIEEFFLKAGFPVWIYMNVFVSSNQSEAIIAHPHIRGVNLTWGEGAGRSIASIAGKYLKPSVLELGGNDAFIVLDTHDIKSIALKAVGARCGNGGQRCNSSKRFIVLEKYYEDFCRELAIAFAQLKLGDPMIPTTQLQPLAKAELVDEVDKQVQKTILEWAVCLTGGKKLWGNNYFEPTVLIGVTPKMTSYKEEVFGPVASVIMVRDIEEAISVANDSDFWLCGSVWWDDIEQCKYVAQRVQTGMIFINAPAWSRAHLPFWGIKKSGYGKENGTEGLKSFTNKKVIVY